MFPFVVMSSILAMIMSSSSMLMLFGILMHLPSLDFRLRLLAISGWGSSAIGWALLAAYLLAPILFRALVR